MKKCESSPICSFNFIPVVDTQKNYLQQGFTSWDRVKMQYS